MLEAVHVDGRTLMPAKLARKANQRVLLRVDAVEKGLVIIGEL